MCLFSLYLKYKERETQPDLQTWRSSLSLFTPQMHMAAAEASARLQAAPSVNPGLLRQGHGLAPAACQGVHEQEAELEAEIPERPWGTCTSQAVT